MTERANKKRSWTYIQSCFVESQLKTLTKSKGKQKETFDATSSNPNPKKFSKTSATPLPKTFKVVAGSYEKLLYGLEGTTSINENSEVEFHLKPIFIFPAHVSCIKAVAASPDGWDLRRRKEIGGLMHHEDGTLCLFRARDWTVLRSLKGHKGRVNSIAVHPSGKVALSVGKDRVLRMWDLMRGKGVASTKIGKEGELVRWSIDGSLFIVQSGSTIDVYTTDVTLIHTIRHSSRIHDVKFGDVMLVGAEDKKLSVYEVSKDPDQTPRVIAQMVGHTNRVKAVQTLNIALPEVSGRAQTTIVSTISSDGYVNIYDLATLPEKPSEDGKLLEISPVASYDSKNTRFTCITLADGDIPIEIAGKRKRDESGDESEKKQEEVEEEWKGVEEQEEEGEAEENVEESD
ncbi:WD40-repeat-containing domain protein [Cyathus striatus]|nr:WD40-repeat-containing domain protein [Cyathus striatus]